MVPMTLTSMPPLKGFRFCRYRLSTLSYRHARADALKLWEGYAARLSA